MSDRRVREAERDVAANPCAATRDRLATERARVGDGPWLPSLIYVDPAVEVIGMFTGTGGTWVDYADLARAWTRSMLGVPRHFLTIEDPT